ncbi:MAG: membrane protein [Lysobacteraceae bacterium]|nr:MAG: membrane protein [Xanthomonadaceae bacterium]
MGRMITTWLIIGVLLIIVYNLGSGLYYMFVDKGKSDRMLNALTRRIIISVSLFALLLLGIATGYIKPHGLEPAKSSVAEDSEG